MTEPLYVAFVWHMHQPYYRSALSGAFDMPWARMHALKDYADMIDTLSTYPRLHHTFNLVPSLVEQLETYAAGDFSDVYWDHTLKPAAELDDAERAFLVERMCERPDHPRARAFPRYLELAKKRDACHSLGWTRCARTFSVDELRDLQVWFNLAWFDPVTLETGALSELAAKGRGFTESDKLALARTQQSVLSTTLPAYRTAAQRGQIELTTSPYFHPILPLLCNTDSTRIGASHAILPPRRFAHPEDAREQIASALDKHASVFGERPAGMWCSEQAVGEDVLPLLLEAGVRWTLSDEAVLGRSLAGAAPLDLASRAQTHAGGDGAVHAGGASLIPSELYAAYRLEREGSELAMIFRDHTLSDLIGFAYQSWDSRDAANDLLRRLREIRDDPRLRPSGRSGGPPLVTIALDGENAWEYYPRDGRDFLECLYEGLAKDESLQCVTVSEYLKEHPPIRSLGWLHTGSWIGGDLRTWSGDQGHNAAWDLLHSARDLAAAACATLAESGATGQAERIWRHILVAEGSDWYWWFGDHHHTELDYVWDRNFRLHLQAVYEALGRPIPLELLFPVLGESPPSETSPPAGPVTPTIDGMLGSSDEWTGAGYLTPDLFSTMQPSETARIREIRFGWMGESLCLLVVPTEDSALDGLEVEIRLAAVDVPGGLLVRVALSRGGELEDAGRVAIAAQADDHPQGSDAAQPRVDLSAAPTAAWRAVLEVCMPLTSEAYRMAASMALIVTVGRNNLTERVFHSNNLVSA